jgi:hypothetical protein
LTGRRVKMNCFGAFPPFCFSVHVVVVLTFMLILGGEKFVQKRYTSFSIALRAR